jgi:aldose 1-epimerase
LAISMAAETDQPTIINLASHGYWNLAGHDSGSIIDHELMIAANQYTTVDDELIPTGEIADVAGTIFDFRSQRPIGAKMPKSGYDLNYVLDGPSGSMNLACRLAHLPSGRMLELSTDQPGLQIYTGAGLNPSMIGRDGIAYQPFGGIALETQKFPDAVNHPHFPSIRLVPGEIYRHNSIFRFINF